MTDQQIETLFNAITDFDEFQSKVAASEDIALNEDVVICFEGKSVTINFSSIPVKISRKEFDQINDEIRSQHKSDTIFKGIEEKKRTLSDRSINIRDDKTFVCDG